MNAFGDRWAGALVLGALLLCVLQVLSAEDELAARDYCIDTVLAAEGKPEVVIVSSGRRPAYAAVAERVRGRIRELSGVDVPVLDAEKCSTKEVLGKSNAIVLGNLATSPFVEALYWEWYTLLDLWYPGQGGYVVRTLHDPYGTGKNVIFLAGSDDRGVAQAAEVFCRDLKKSDPLKVGRLMDIKLGENHKVPPKGEWTDPRLRIFHEPLHHRTVHEAPLGVTDASLAGLRYYYNGDKEALKRFREVALSTDILGECYHYYAHMHPIVWELIEEDPFFSDEDRRKITAKLLTGARGKDGTAGRARLLSDAKLHKESKKLLDRHSAMHANCTLTHSRYFAKYWPSEEWTQNLEAVRAYFDRPMTSGKGWRDEGNMHTYLECSMIAALLLRDRRLVESGALRHYAELVLMFCDNGGHMTTYGGGYPSTTLRTCAALLDDGGFLATLPRREEQERAAGKYPVPYGFLHGQAWATGLKPEPMKKMVGVYRGPLTRWQWEFYGKGFPFEKGVDKLTMRSGFGRNDQYLLLDGISVGGGKPCPNRNAILSFGQNGHVFLRGGTNSMVVSREGLGQKQGKIVSLENAANLPTFGYSHTRAADHPFSVWDRRLFWRKGKWFVLLDSVTVKEAGRYSITCSVGYGRATVQYTRGEGKDRNVFNIRNAEAASGDFSAQALNRDMKAGDRAVMTNLFYADGGPPPQSYVIVKIGEAAAAITGDEKAYVGLTKDGAFERDGVAVQGAAFCISPSSIAVVHGTSIRCGGLVIKASAPCNMELEPSSGRVTVEADQKTSVTIGTATHACEPGTHTFTAEKPAPAQMAALADAIERDAAQATREAQPPSRVPKGLPPIPTAWSLKVGSYTSYCVGDVNGDGKTETLIGLADGRAGSVSAEGNVLWEFKTGGAVRAVSYATLKSGPAVLIGSEDEHVYAVTADSGKLLWKHKCHFSEDRFQRAPWWTTQGKAKVLTIFPRDLNGDGDVEIVCGTGAGFVETLASDGKRKWLCEFMWGLPDLFNTVPMPDGSTTLLVDATKSACGSFTWRLDANGKVLKKNVFATGRGSWDSTKVMCCRVVDMDGKGTWMAILGRGGVYNELALHDAVTGKQKWIHKLAKAATDVTAVDLDGDGVKEVVAASLSGWLTAFDINGKSRWAVRLPSAIIAVASTADALFVQFSDAGIYRLSFAGEITGRYVPKVRRAPSPYQHWRFQRGNGTLLAGDRSGVVAPLAVPGD